MTVGRNSISMSALLIFANSLLAEQPKSSPTPPIIPEAPALTAENIRSGKIKAVALFAPKPEYPKYARDRHWTGVGWYVMHVKTRTGLVMSVEVTQSTGHKMLDDVCVNALRRWRFKPGVVAPKVNTPITF